MYHPWKNSQKALTSVATGDMRYTWEVFKIMKVKIY